MARNDKKVISTEEYETYYYNKKKGRRRKTRGGKKSEQPAIVKPHYKLSPELTEHEREIIESLSDGVYFKPRPRFLGFTYSKEMPKWQALGFASEIEYHGFLESNKLDNPMHNGYEMDILHFTDGGGCDE